MLDLTSRTLLLAGAVAVALSSIASNAIPTAATTSNAKWIYWTTSTATTQLSTSAWMCASEVAKVHLNDTAVYYLHRSPADDSACIRATDHIQVRGPEKVVVFKPESVSSDLLQAQTEGQSWTSRSVKALRTAFKEAASEYMTSEIGDQVAFSLSSSSQAIEGPEILAINEHNILLALPETLLTTIDQYTTFDTRIQHLVFHPVSSFTTKADGDKKPEPHYPKPKYNSYIASLASLPTRNTSHILSDLRILTGEDAQPSQVGSWHSRHSSTYGARRAGAWVKGELEESLKRVNGSCNFWVYSPYFAPNVVCHIPASAPGEGKNVRGEPEGTVLISAHYDSRGSFGETTAPGGDDDGSGTAALLSIARALSSLPSIPHTITSPIQLVAFSGEEQGLVGSQRYASHLSDLNTPIKLALQMDMLAYHSPSEPLQLAFPDKLSTNSATAFVKQVADIYAPELEQGYTPACCSDHQSFWEQGFPATWVFERNGPIADPMYHNSGDVTEREGYDVKQLGSIAKVVAATLLHAAVEF